MFGYVLPSARQLTAQEQQRFESAYCGLCHTLGRRYGTAGRMILNYDLTFLAILLSEGNRLHQTVHCAPHPGPPVLLRQLCL